MRSRSSTSNSRRFPAAALAALAIIAAIETRQAGPLESGCANHEVDAVLRQIGRDRFDARVLVIGDSVGGQLAESLGLRADGRYAVLTTNQAIETIGQYFLVKRYLETQTPPDLVLYLSACPLGDRLNQVYTENFFQRCFTRAEEIAGASSYLLNPSFTLKMLAYKWLPSYRYRLHLQREWLGEAGAPPYTGLADKERALRRLWDSPLRKVAFAVDQLTGRAPVNVSYFERLIRLLEDRGIRLLHVQAPVSDTRARTRRFRSDHRAGLLRSMDERHPLFETVAPDPWILDDSFFKDDGTHVRETRRPAVAKRYRDLLAGAGRLPS